MSETDDSGGPAEREAAEALLPEVYDELRRLAGGILRDERPGHTLEPTALVHEAYLRVQKQTGIAWKNPGHLRAVTAQAMRRVLVDHARAKQAAKRGGGERAVTLVSQLIGSETEGALDALALEEALLELETRDPRQARIAELRFFGGMTNRETAEALGVSETTVEDDWRFARAWLNRRLGD